MDVSIIIVSWNVREHLEQCLQSLEAAARGLNVEVFIIDNNSSDGTQQWLRSQELKIKNQRENVLHHSLFVIHNANNRGFAKANNQAIAQTTGEYILLLNPDTECTDEALHAMRDFMRAHPRCGIVGSRLLNSDGSPQPSIRRFPDWLSPTLLSFGLRIGPVQRYLARDFDYEKVQQVDQVMGACFFIRRTMLQEIGILDERFFIWFEEVDYCKRAKYAGWEVWYTPNAVVVHHGGESFAQVVTIKKQWMFSKSLLQYFWKHHQWGGFFFTFCTVPFRLFFSLFFR